MQASQPINSTPPTASRQPTTAQSATHDWTVGNSRLVSRQPTTVQSATHNWTVGNPQLTTAKKRNHTLTIRT
ncbi:MAG: hypothetical protein LBH04_11775 [Tannerellaceae bacterium]|nr:hypothetical protein [Tannerellaceae bacterium]